MREPETLNELIEYMEWSCDRREDDFSVMLTLSDGDGFHELLEDLKMHRDIGKEESSSSYDNKHARINSEFEKYLEESSS